MKVAKWGNSLAVRLPRAVVEVMGLKEGDDVKIGVAGSAELKIAATPDRLALLESLEKYQGRLPADFKFDRREANSRE
ncbi:MAG: AbrB/MazE/SpoVT family DNA-binding domain-containing protein [Caulobacterales bacterium]|jgi:antitoxin MazE